jgi:uncharacterized protein YjiS (DUF1127 family)
MTTIHRDSRLAPTHRDVPGYLGAASNRLVELLSAWRLRRRTRAELQARSDYAVPEDIGLTRVKIDPQWLRLEWF